MSYEHVSNERIVIQLQKQFDDQLFQELFSRFIPMYHKYYHQIPIVSYDIQDYYQEGRICLLKVVNTFIQSTYNFVAGYFSKIYQNHLINLQRQYIAKKRQGEQHVISLNEPITKDKTKQLYFEDMVSETGEDIFELIATKEMLIEFIGSLSELESEVIRHKIFDEDNRASAIAEKMQISVRSVENAIARFRAKLKKHLTKEQV